jgi:hypothetical protein
MINLLFVSAVACTLTYTIPSGMVPRFENDDIKYVKLLGYPRCPVWDASPFNWKPCQYSASILLIKNIEGKQGKRDTLVTGPLNTTWTLWVLIGDEVTNWSPISNFVSNKFP